MSLSSRLERVMASSPKEDIEEFRQLDLETMSQHRITFGKTHVGKTFAEMWEGEKTWMKWFAKTYQASPKIEHQKVLIYLEKILDQYEHTHGMVPLKNPEDLQGVVLPRHKCMPKSRAMPAHQVPVEETAEEEADPSDPWDVMDFTTMQQTYATEAVEDLQSRVQTMEGALNEILAHLRKGN